MTKISSHNSKILLTLLFEPKESLTKENTKYALFSKMISEQNNTSTHMWFHAIPQLGMYQSILFKPLCIGLINKLIFNVVKFILSNEEGFDNSTPLHVVAAKLC